MSGQHYRHSMPLGLPRAGEGGMDETPTWGTHLLGRSAVPSGRPMWRYAEQTASNRAGRLQPTLRAILKETGDIGRNADIDEVTCASEMPPPAPGCWKISTQQGQGNAVDLLISATVDLPRGSGGPEIAALRRSRAARGHSRRYYCSDIGRSGIRAPLSHVSTPAPWY